MSLTTINKKIKFEDAEDFIITFTKIIEGNNNKFLIPAGSYRRKQPYLNDIDLISFRPLEYLLEKIKDKEAKLKLFKIKIIKNIVSGPAHTSLIVSFHSDFYNKKIKFQLDLFYAPSGECISSLLHWTGNKNFNIRMRAQAKRLGYKLSQHGLFFTNSGKKVTGIKSEKDIFRLLKVTYKRPEERQE
jgi:DNA polymerase/3'-5' exonuclease PolX